MKWLVRIAAGTAIGLIIVQVFIRHQYIPRFAAAIAAILIGVGLYEGVDMSRFFGDDDDDDSNGPLRPA